MNMTKSAFLFVLLLFSVRAFGQTDTIFSNNEKIPCIVKEIKESSVVYVHPGEELLNSIYKNAVQKIVFKNGRGCQRQSGGNHRTVQSGASEEPGVPEA